MGTHGSFKSEGFYRFDSLAGGKKKIFRRETDTHPFVELLEVDIKFLLQSLAAIFGGNIIRPLSTLRSDIGIGATGRTVSDFPPICCGCK